MDYTIKKEGVQWCVYDKAGKKIDEFSSRMAAIKKIRELMRAAKKPDSEGKAETAAAGEEAE
jgi:hypothetical protein